MNQPCPQCTSVEVLTRLDARGEVERFDSVEKLTSKNKCRDNEEQGPIVRRIGPE